MHTPLYIKTDNSLLKSLIKIDNLIEFAKENDIKVLTITDDNMCGVIEFYVKCIKNNIKPIVGLEVDNILLYAMNYEGYQNLTKLSTISSERKILIDDLINYSSNLICIVLYEKRSMYKELSKYFEYIFQGYSSLDEKRDLEGELIYVNEILYFEEKEAPYLKYLYAIKDGISIDEVKITKKNNHFFNYKLYIDENNEKIEKLCNLEIPFHNDLLPVYVCPDNMDSYTYLKKLVKEGLKSKFGEVVPKIYLDRLKYELEIINKMGFCNYFLIVWDYVNFAKKNNILTCNRGSAAGSLVSFCLGITPVDSIKYNLFFERFLNPERISMPDIDIDFEYNRREEVINYCINKYGLKKTAPIITFGTLGSKQVIRDVSRCMKLDLKQVDKICKLIDSTKTLKENYNNLKLQQLLNNEFKKMYQIAIKFEGLKRHTSIHAAGIVISNKDLDDVIPLVYHNDFYITGYSMEYLEDLGLLKMDILALKNLTLLNDVLKEVNISLDDIPLDDNKTYRLFASADTMGIFQFESKGMMNFLRKFKPTNFEDLIAAIALYRPGPMENINTYIKRKNGKEKIDYIDNQLIPILKSTYGIIIYQEQIMQIANKLALYTLAEADVLRKAMSKKKEDVLIHEKDKFVNRAISNGISEENAIKVYDLILKFASYGFNRAHSVAYSMLAYKMAYLKVHYPNIFIKHLLNSVIASDKTKEYIDEARKRGLDIQAPDINISKNTYVIYNNKIYYPFTNIKNIGENIAKEIVSKQPFKDIFDFKMRCNVSSNVLETLIKANCFRSFNLSQKTLDDNLDLIINYSELGSLLDDDLKPILNNNSCYDKKTLMQRELEVFGFYLTGHPLSIYRRDYKLKISDLKNYFAKTVNIIVLIDKIKTVLTKNNEKMLFITGSDEESTIDIVVFPKKYRNDLKVGSVYLINGRVEKRFAQQQLVVNEIKEL